MDGHRLTTFANKLRELRRASGMTLRVLGERAQLDYSYLSRVESATVRNPVYPSETAISRLAAVLEANERELRLLAGKFSGEDLDLLGEKGAEFLGALMCAGLQSPITGEEWLTLNKSLSKLQKVRKPTKK